ncbi:dienelactone hydrolase [Rubrobacter xylanophilus DSM 9941]|uniref:Dienelactone hydrolase n=1 Tax=Rubrobacter xylanophilus (strain DSM 9941 / JCM 11954 / NBRC 16129 / PRD-1) TaxID=266117 RepID=Q1AYS2_RUBXD|nr:alpha/beta fold hydrolase [Rubrobacter xylanophilus]ABG03456.1 dienelactone hydrolase [Rubrobacter xylanophilus DSM 9941]
MSVGETVRIEAGGARIEGDLEIPEGARGIVLFAHGSGSGRHSPRNRFVAARLREESLLLGTLLIDLLTEQEEAEDARTGLLRFDVGLLAGRVEAATRWLLDNPRTRGLRVGYFGASTGAAAALVAAARLPEAVGAVVSRGGRPDLAGEHLGRVRAPVLLIVGGRDHTVLELNREAMRRLPPQTRLEVVPGATHLFEEPGALEEVARLAARWFARHLAGGR